MSAVVLVLYGSLQLLVMQLFVAPVVNLVLDLAVKALIRANEPPVLGYTTGGNYSNVVVTYSRPLDFVSAKDDPHGMHKIISPHVNTSQATPPFNAQP